MDLPQPPPDQELKNIIDKLAQFVARNGPEFEQMTKSKQKDNPKFSFLFGGDYFNYYQYKVTTEQAIIKHRQQHQPPQHLLPPPQQSITTVGNIQTTPQTYPPPIATYPTAAQYPNYSYPPSSLHQQPPYPPSSQPPVGYAGYPPSSQPSPYINNNSDTRHDNFSTAPPPRYPDQYDQQPLAPEPALHQQPPPPLPPASDSYQSISSSLASVSVSSSSDSSNFSVHPPGEGRNPYTAPSLADQPPPPTSQFSQSLPPSSVPDAGAAVAAAAAAAASASNAAAIESIVQQQQTLQEQIKQSEQNLTAQHQVLQQQKDSQIKEGLYVAKGEMLKKEAEELNLVESELSELLSTITETCTKDSISAGKLWIFTHATDEPRNNWIAQYLNYKATCHSAPFTHKLHIIYLMNDVLHSCVRKGSVELKERLQQVLVPMFCHAATSAPEDKKAKLEKLLSLWEGKLKLEDHILVQLQNPKESWAALEKRHHEEFPQVIQTITHHLDTTFEGYKQQHNAFVQHAATQLQQLEQQKQQLEQQQHQQQAVAAAQAAAANLAASHQQQQLQQPPPQPPQQQPPLDHLNVPPPGFGSGAPAPPVPMVDFSRPPPGFPGSLVPTDVPPPIQQPPPTDVQKENLVPSIPYFELPAGLMCPIVAEEDTKYRPLDPSKIRLPAPAPPTERLLRAVDNFYLPPSHERPRNSEGWEQLSLYDYYKGKSEAVKRKQDAIDAGEREQSESPPPVVILTPPPDKPESEVPVRRYSSVSPEKDVPDQSMKTNTNGDRTNRSPARSPGRELYSPSRSPRSDRRSPRSERRSSPTRRSPRRSPSRRSPRRSPRRSRSRSGSPGSRSRSGSESPSAVDRVPFRRSPSRSPTPPSFGGASFGQMEQRLSESNKGHQMLRKMGWGGSGLGAKEQGIENPIDAGDVRDDPQERFRGLGVPTAKTDPFEAFRKNKGKAFITRMKARAEEKL